MVDLPVVMDRSLLSRKFFTLRAPRRGGDRESFRENSSNKSYFANFSDAADARGFRELPVVKISALNDPWRYQKRHKNEKKNVFFHSFGIQFFIIFDRFWNS